MRPLFVASEAGRVNSYRVLRGGSWNLNTTPLRAAYRFNNYPPSDRYFNYGFRCARSAP